MEYYSNPYHSEQVTSSGTGTKKILPQIPHSRIKLSPSLPQTYQKVQRRNTIDQRSSSLDHKDNDDYEYSDNLANKGQFEEYDDVYYNDKINVLQHDQQQYTPNNSSNMANAKIEYEIQREIVQEEKKEENEGFTRRDTFKKFYQRTVKHLENPRSFFQQHTDSGESQEEHKEVIYTSYIIVTIDNFNKNTFQHFNIFYNNKMKQIKILFCTTL